MNQSREDLVGDFAGFSDRPESPFYCSTGISAVETWDRSVDSMAILLLELPAVVREPGFQFTPALLSHWHDRIFGSLFPREAGRLRWRRDGDWEHVYFGGNVGTVRSRRTKGYRGVHPQKLQGRLGEICEEFNQARQSMIEAAPGATSINDAAYAGARLYAKLLRAHPFVDGNLRVAFVALHAALLALDLPRVTFPDLELHDDLIGVAFRNDNEPYLQLANCIADTFVMNLPIDASATLNSEMIRYSDYNGPQHDVVVRDGHVVQFDRDAAHEMAHHAHMLAIGVPEQVASVGVSEQSVAAAA